MYYRVCFIIILSYSAFAAKEWRDPHEMKFDNPHAEESPNSNTATETHACLEQNEEELKVLTYYKRSLKLLTNHLAPRGDDPNIYDFNTFITTPDYIDLMLAIEEVSYDFKKLKRLDDLLSRVHGKRIQDWLKDEVLSWSQYIRMYLLTKEAAVLAFIFMLPVLIYCYKSSSRQTIVMIVLFAVWATDFGVTWFNKYEDLEVDHMVDMSRYQSSSPTCDLTQMWFFQRWFSSLSPTEECKRFYSAKYKNRNYQIGPYDIVVEQAGKVLRIFRFVAIEISKFLSLLTTDIPWPLNWVVIIFVVIGGFYILQLLLFLLFGYSFRFNIAHVFNLEFRNDQNPAINRQNREFRQIVEEVRQIPIRMTEAVHEIANVIQTNNNQARNNISESNNDQQSNLNNDNQRRTNNVNCLENQRVTVTTQTELPVNNSSPNTDLIQVDDNNLLLLPNKPSTSNLIAEPIINDNSGQSLAEPRRDLIQEQSATTKENNDKEDSSSESIEVVGDANRNADFEEYVVVNEGYGDGFRNLHID